MPTADRDGLDEVVADGGTRPEPRVHLPVLMRLLQAHERAGGLPSDALLDASLAQFRTLFHIPTVALFQADASGALLNVNDCLCRLTGYTRAQLLAKSCFDLFHQDDLPNAPAASTPASPGDAANRPESGLGCVIRGELEHCQCDLRLLRSDGSTMRVQVNASASRGHALEPCVTAIVLDFSSGQKQLEEQLAQQRTAAEEATRMLHALMEYIPEGVAIADAPDAAIRYMSRFGRELSGRPEIAPEGIPGARHAEVWGICRPDCTEPASPDELPLTRALRGESIHEEELCIRKPDGTCLPILCHAGPIRDNNDRITGGLLVWRDISRRKRSQQALKTAEERRDLVTRATMDGIWDWNLATSELYWSDRLLEMLGLAPGELAASIDTFNALLHPDDHAATWRQLEEYFGHRTPIFQVEFRLRHKDGSYRWMLSRGIAQFDAAGKPTRMVGAHTDISELKHAQERIRVAMEAAEAANRAKDHFLAILSHELRTPLTPVMAAAHLLEAHAHAPEVRDLAAIIRRNVDVEVRLMDDLLDLTRISRGKFQLHMATVDLDDIVRQAISLCQADLQAKAIGLSVNLSAAHHHLHGDAARLQQVVWNLLKNAVKFTPQQGHIHIDSTNPAPGACTLQISDNGVGIPTEVLPRIFDAFEQGGRDVTRHYGGLGLGLAICKAIVALHHGHITASSEGRGRGATFSVQLPVVHAGSTSHPRPSASYSTRRLNGSILLVEDHEDTRRIMARLLAEMGCTVITAGSVADALAAATERRFDLLVCDIGLPDGTGLDLLRQIPADSRPPAIALSGFGMEDDLKKSLDAGFVAHLTKPVDLQQLEETLRRQLLR